MLNHTYPSQNMKNAILNDIRRLWENHNLYALIISLYIQMFLFYSNSLKISYSIETIGLIFVMLSYIRYEILF